MVILALLMWSAMVILPSFGFVCALVKAIVLAVEKERPWTNWAWGAALCLILVLFMANMLFSIFALWP